MEKELTNIINYLKNRKIELSNDNEDGRINSSINEKTIINLIKEGFEKKVKIPSARYWYDIKINNEPVNIKITSGKSADNISSKKGLYYALTGSTKDYMESWPKYLENLKKNICDNEKDYYFIVVDKNNVNNIIFTSLKKIKNLRPNANNLPFQKKWFCEESEDDEYGTEYLLKVFLQSINKDKKIIYRKKYFPTEEEILEAKKLNDCLNKLGFEKRNLDIIEEIKNLDVIKEILKVGVQK